MFVCFWFLGDVNIAIEVLQIMTSALVAVEQWGFFSVPHILWHGASFYNGHLQRSVTFTTIAESVAVELSLHVFTT